MDGEPAKGPPVSADENLFRAITSRYWYVNGRVSSAAFHEDPPFSADVASLTTPDRTLARFFKGTGLAVFNCGAARAIGFDARLEPDPDFPDNNAHAHVYSEFGSKERKRKARELGEACRILVEPSFDVPPAG